MPPEAAMAATPPPPQLLLFDVNETLLDLAPLRATIAAALGGRAALAPLWFTRLLHQSLVVTVAGAYRPFGELALASLRELAAEQGMALDEAAARDALAPMRSLPAHGDVLPALDRLRGAGKRLVALTNSSAELLVAQLRHAGLEHAFEQALSVDAVGRFKPHPEVYRRAAAACGVGIEDCLLVAAHDWDVAGALWAGARAVLVGREGRRPMTLGPRPETCVEDFSALADYLLALD